MEEKYKNRELVFNESHGFFGENAYGRVMSWDKANQKLIPVICGHGGSMWLCEKCFNKMKNEKMNKQLKEIENNPTFKEASVVWKFLLNLVADGKLSDENANLIFDFIVSIREKDRKKIRKDLLKIADKGEYEDLRREVEYYFEEKKI